MLFKIVMRFMKCFLASVAKQTQVYCIRENKVYINNTMKVWGAFTIYRSASVAQKGLYSDNPKPFNSANFIHFDDQTNLSDPPTNGKWI